MPSGFAFIIPYRDREQHLEEWIAHYRQIFGEDLNLIVVEQADDKPFARGPLFNVGYLEAGKEYDYCAYSDVDMLIDLRRSNPLEAYEYPINPTHISTKLHRSGYNAMHPSFFGGVVLLSKKHMEQSEGWNSEIFGWGVEDDAMRDRLEKVGFKIDKREVYFDELPHKRNIIPHLLRENLNMVKEKSWSGMKNQRYKVLTLDTFNRYLHIKVEFA